MRLQSKKHRDFINTLPCLCCPDSAHTEAAHVRFADARVAKPITGMRIKPDDCYVVPLCGKHHRLQHSGSERSFWDAQGIDPILIALALWAYSGDFEQCVAIIRQARNSGCGVQTHYATTAA